MKEYSSPKWEVVKVEVKNTFASYPSGCEVWQGQLVGECSNNDITNGWWAQGTIGCVITPHLGYDYTA